MARTKQTDYRKVNLRQGKIARFGKDGLRPSMSSSKQTKTGEQQAGTSSGSCQRDEPEAQETGSSDPETQNGQQTVQSVMEAIKEELICAICTDILKQPKMLICSHTFCLQCLQDLMAQHDEEADIECPKCRHVTDMEVHDGIIENLPTNLIAQNLVEKLEREGKRNKDSLKYKCSIHVDEALNLYCETCKEAICRECALFVHCKPDHLYLNIGDFVSKQKNLTLIKMHQLLDKNVELKSKLEKYGQFHQDWTMCTKRAEFRVKKSANIVREKVNKDEQQKLELIKDKEHMQNTLFKNYGDNFGSLMQKISKAIYSQADLAKIPDIDYLAIHETLNENVEHLLKQTLPDFDHEAWHCNVLFEPNENLTDEEFSLGKVSVTKGEGMAELNSRGVIKHGVKRRGEPADKSENISSSEEASTEECLSKKKLVQYCCGCKKRQKMIPSQQGENETDPKMSCATSPTNGHTSAAAGEAELGNISTVSSAVKEETIKEMDMTRRTPPQYTTEGGNNSELADIFEEQVQ